MSAGWKKEPFTGRRTGSVIRWKPDTDVFTDINVPADTFKDMLRRQAVVNDGVTLVFNDRTGERAEKTRIFTMSMAFRTMPMRSPVREP